MATRKRSKVAKAVEEAPPIEETVEPEVVNETLLSQTRFASARNEAVIADIGKRAAEGMRLVNEAIADLDKIIRVNI